MIIQSTKVYYEEKLQPLQVEIQGDIITGIYQYNQFPCDKDYGNYIIMPGLIDVHNHGYNDCDSNHATEAWLKQWTQYLPSEGVTSTLASISSSPKEGLLVALKNIGNWIEGNNPGTHILGVYSEGPFISSGKEKGAQSLEYQLIPTKEIIDEFNNACQGHLIYVMIAPEMLNDDYSVIDYCVKNKMSVSLGHTGATFDICQKAVSHGATSFTHTYNGMKGLHHREPGVVGAAMYFDHCYAECICDGVHVHEVAANALAKTKGKDKFILITDSVSLKGQPIGKSMTKDGQVRYICEDGVGRLEDGTIAGSCHRLNEVLAYAIKKANIPLVTCLNAVTINPARMLGIANLGLIARNYRADIAIFDEDFNNIETYISGVKFQK